MALAKVALSVAEELEALATVALSVVEELEALAKVTLSVTEELETSAGAAPVTTLERAGPGKSYGPTSGLVKT